MRGACSRRAKSALRVPSSSSGCWPTASWSGLRAAQGVLRLRDRFGAARLEAACARALLHASPYYRTVKTILTGGFDQLPLDGADGAHIHAPGARFARSAQLLFNPDAPRH